MPRAIIVRGEPVFCAADVRTWHESGLHFAARPQRRETRAVVLHWTGGERDAAGVHETLSDRKPHPLSVQFFVDQRGTIWQYTDANALCAQCQGFNVESVGIEIANRADPDVESSRWPRAVHVERVHGHERRTTSFYPEQVAAARELTRALCAAYGLPLDVPRDTSGELVTTALPAEALRTYRGVVGHYHVTTRKDDPGPDLLRQVVP